jgi:hypothetical protein
MCDCCSWKHYTGQAVDSEMDLVMMLIGGVEEQKSRLLSSERRVCAQGRGVMKIF